ncbi:hypothetical protein [Schlesneria sp. T3-172]|uniref:hypothetical protein n=1 Tax=Schlesneria sphaerica TaxID=3373610 RepID=UPI0037C84E20
MQPHREVRFDEDVTHLIRPELKNALSLLLQAHETAFRLSLPKWEFALEVHSIKEAGLNNNDLRYLICQGMTEHRVEITRRGARQRSFELPPGMSIDARSCFVLADERVQLVQKMISNGPTVMDASHSSPQRGPHAAIPFWDCHHRELRVGEILAKRFRQPAKNQEAILNAFQEEGWPPRIDNPIAAAVSTDAIERLHDAVKRLNHQINPVIRFFSDGQGRGVTWKQRAAQ